MKRTHQFLGVCFIPFFTQVLVSCNNPQQTQQSPGVASSPVSMPSPSIPIPTGTPEPEAIHYPYPISRGQDFRGEKNFAYLLNHYPQGKGAPTPWAGYWWPYTSNGIATGEYGFSSSRDRFSPAGKYDAARGRRTHAQDWEIRHHGAHVPKVQSWWGHCNGWCVAAALIPEPNEPVTVNGIEFGIGDIKALLSEAGMSANADFFGERTDVDDPSSPKYWDTVPNQYFLVLTNYMGQMKKTVLIDRFTGSQVWNQPLAGYRIEYPKPSDYLGNTPEAPNVYRIMVTSTLWWMDDGVAPDIQTHRFNFEEEDPTGVVQSRTLKMEVWVDRPIVFDGSGRITSSGDVIVSRQGDYVVGGAWRMGEGYYVDAWPDYMWIPYNLVKPTDPDQDYVNPEIDSDWIKKHLVNKEEDHSVEPGPIAPAPYPSTSPSGGPSWPWPGPTSSPIPGL